MDEACKEMISKVEASVIDFLSRDKTAHGAKHAKDVAKLACRIANQEGAALDIVELAALLHDVDDYKLFGQECAKDLTNARRILNGASIPNDTVERVLDAIHSIGYSKRLKGIIPKTLEAKVVSDADMLEGMGITGIMRTHEYNLMKGNKFFDPDIWPVKELSPDEYMAQEHKQTVVTHMFEKLLKLRDMMLTDAGYEMALVRHRSMIIVLYAFFQEQKATEWSQYLDNFLLNTSSVQIQL